MQLMLLVETAVLLALSQLTLGAVGYLLKGIPVVGLLLIFFLGWMIIRTARVFREEMGRAVRLGVPLTPWVTALLVAVLWQLPALACVPYWAPAPAVRIWQGALLPVPGTLELLPGPVLPVEPALWLALPLEMALFVWVAASGVGPVLTVRPRAAVAAATMSGGTRGTGEWAPARRRKDIVKRRPDPDLEPGEKE